MSSTLHQRGPSPEEEANELHHLPVERGLAWLLLGFFLLLITVRPLLSLRSEEVRRVFTTFAEQLTLAKDKDGAREKNRQLRRAIQEFDDDLEKNSRFSDRLQPIWHQALASLGSGHETVHVGKNGWLEYRPAFEYVTGAPILDPFRLRAWPDADPRPAIQKFAADLALRGIVLWVMPAPSKVMVHPESFAPELRDAAEELDNPSFAALRQELRAAGIRVFEPLPVLRQLAREKQVYFKTDSHWNPLGIDATAAALAAALEAEVPLGPRSKEWRRQTQQLDYAGDLARMLHLENSPDYPPELVEVQVVTDAKGRLWKNDPQAEVLLLGDSFANIFSPRGAGLAAQLAFYLGRDVDRVVMDGGGPVGTREQLDRELRQKPHRRLATTKVVVLEFAARELAIGRWRVLQLRRPT